MGREGSRIVQASGRRALWGAAWSHTRGKHEPRQTHERSLRELFQVVSLLIESGETANTAGAWLIGSNPQLQDGAPIEVFHEGAFDQVRRAAEAFTAGG